MKKHIKHNHLPEIEEKVTKTGRRRRHRLVWIAVLTAGVLALAGLIWAANRPDQPEIISETAYLGRLIRTVEAVGELKSAEKVELSFELAGSLEFAGVSVGDEVFAGQELARLRAQEWQADAERARQGVQIAQARLDERLAGATGEAVIAAKAAVQSAQARLSSSKVDWQNRQAEAEATKESTASSAAEARVAVKSAEDALESQRQKNTQSSSDLESDLDGVLRNNMIALRGALSSADSVLGIDNTGANDAFQSVLGILDSQALVRAQNEYKKAAASRARAEAKVFGLDSDSLSADRQEAVYFTQAAFLDAQNALWYTRLVLEGTPSGIVSFSEADLAALKSNIDAARERVQSARAALQAHLQLIDSTRLANESSETAALNNLNAAQQALASALASQTSRNAAADSAVRFAWAQIQVANGDLLQAEANLQQVLAGPRAVDVAALQAQVQQARADLVAAEARLEKTRLIAPMAGLVTKFEAKPGELAPAGQPILTLQALPNGLYVAANIAESDIAKISLNDSASVTFDAFGDDVRIAGFVSAINPAEKTVEGVVYYEVEVSLDSQTSRPGLKPGMTADVEILTAEIHNALIVSQRAVLTGPNGRKYVRVPGGDLFVEREVVIGLRGDGGKVEIKKGLSEGEEVILTIREQK